MCVTCPMFHCNIAAYEYKWTINRMTLRWGGKEQEQDKQRSSDSKENKNQLILMSFRVFYASLVISGTKDENRECKRKDGRERNRWFLWYRSSIKVEEHSRIMLQHVWPLRAGKCHSLQCHTSSHPRIPFCTLRLYITSMCSVVFISWQTHWVCVAVLYSFDLFYTLNMHCRTHFSEMLPYDILESFPKQVFQ